MFKISNLRERETTPTNLAFLSSALIFSGKYICDGDARADNRYRYAAPQAIMDGPTTEC